MSLNAPVMESYLRLQLYQKRLQQRCSPVKLDIYGKLPVVTSQLPCKDFFDSSYENASFQILEDSMWLQLVCARMCLFPITVKVSPD